MSVVLKLSSIKTPDFFTVNLELAPVVLHLLQYGVINLEMVERTHGAARHTGYMGWVYRFLFMGLA